MAPIPPVFVVREGGERTVVSFLDWQSAAGMFYRSETAAFADEARKQVDRLVAEHHCKVLAFDISPIDLLPSACLGLLVALTQTDVEIELLHPSSSVAKWGGENGMFRGTLGSRGAKLGDPTVGKGETGARIRGAVLCGSRRFLIRRNGVMRTLADSG